MKISKAVAILVVSLIVYFVIALILTGELCGCVYYDCYCDIAGMRIPQNIWYGLLFSIPILIIGIGVCLIHFFGKKK